ncbi:MAG: tRNA epoxyqueuosine(34) reductase QueG [Burkholderiaceae bacterium]
MHYEQADWLKKLNLWGRTLGFSQIGIADVNLQDSEPGLLAWLAAGFHGDMGYMDKHGLRRTRPAELVPGTVSIITARMDYLPKPDAGDSVSDWRDEAWEAMGQPDQGYVSLYARGRDYHKVMRQRLQKLAQRLSDEVGPMGFRVFTDSAPVMEAALAVKSGQGWRGKHSLVLNREGGSFFFLGEIYVDMAFTPTPSVAAHCGECTACMTVCPTQAIVAPYQLDARRCISYLTIEHAGEIPEDLRAAMGNRIYGCDDCQLACPWNKYAQVCSVPDFTPRDAFNNPDLLALWSWDEATFLAQTEGSAIRRIGHDRWLRNLATAMGNALADGRTSAKRRESFHNALNDRIDHKNVVVRAHIRWALAQKP